MREIAHAAIDAGADIVIGHGPHYSLPVEVYRGKPIFYGLGSFSFHTGHGGRRHGDWIGMMVRATVADRAIAGVSFRFVRHNDRNETVPCRLAEEAAELDDIQTRSAPYGTRLIERGDEVVIGRRRGPARSRPPLRQPLPRCRRRRPADTGKRETRRHVPVAARPDGPSPARWTASRHSETHNHRSKQSTRLPRPDEWPARPERRLDQCSARARRSGQRQCRRCGQNKSSIAILLRRRYAVAMWRAEPSVAGVCWPPAMWVAHARMACRNVTLCDSRSPKRPKSGFFVSLPLK